MPLLVIGKSKQPHCLRGVKTYPVTWRNNPTAWMTGPLFTEWLQKVREKSEIALVIDNCRAHPKIDGLKAVKLVWLPPNTTSLTQPMDQGIIATLKSLYRKKLIQDGRLKAMDKAEPHHLTILDMMHALRSAWKSVKLKTIANCYRHCGFDVPASGDPQPGPSLDPAWTILCPRYTA